MSRSWWSSVSYRLFVALAIGGAMLPVDASARLPEAMHSFSIRHVSAIHHPTGCVAMLEYNRNTLLAAFITDPLCLPRGVTSRSIPAFEHDFHVPGTGREVFTTR